MTQAELNRAVAQVTGESVARIKRLGFLLADSDSEIEIADLGSKEHRPHIVDWDDLDEPVPLGDYLDISAGVGV